MDLERAAAALPALRFAPAPSDAVLGARAASAGLDDGTVLVLLEPETEGHLAAFLARHGEGPAVLYLLADPARPPGLAERPTPVGPSGRLLQGSDPAGPFLVAVGAPPAVAAEATLTPGALPEPS